LRKDPRGPLTAVEQALGNGPGRLNILLACEFWPPCIVDCSGVTFKRQPRAVPMDRLFDRISYRCLA